MNKVLIKLNKKDIESHIKSIIRVVPGREIAEITSAVIIVQEENEVFFTATNYNNDIEIVVKMNGDYKGYRGTMVIRTKDFVNLVKDAPENDILLEAKDKRISFVSGKFSASLSSVSTDTFSILIKFTMPGTFRTEFKVLRAIAKKISKFANSFGGRMVFEGVGIGKGLAVATDSRALAIYKNESLDFGIEGVIIPADFMMNVGSLDFADDDIVGVDISANKIVFGVFKEWGTIKMSANMIAGPYPDITNIIPDNTLKLVISKEEIEGMIGRIKVLTDSVKDTSCITKVALRADHTTKEYKLVYNSSNGKESIESYPYVSWNGEFYSIVLNLEFLNKVVAVCDNLQLTIMFNIDSTKGMVVIDNDCKYLIMPIRG